MDRAPRAPLTIYVGVLAVLIAVAFLLSDSGTETSAVQSPSPITGAFVDQLLNFFFPSQPAQQTQGFGSQQLFQPQTDVTSCQTISASGNYDLTQNIAAGKTCINITSSNVNLSCQGFRIDFDGSGSVDSVPASGIYVSNESPAISNVVIRNCIVNDTTTDGGFNNYAVYIFNVTNSRVENSVIYVSGEHPRGIRLTETSNINISSNNITVFRHMGSTSYAIGIEWALHGAQANIEHNYIQVISNRSAGIADVGAAPSMGGASIFSNRINILQNGTDISFAAAGFLLGAIAGALFENSTLSFNNVTIASDVSPTSLSASGLNNVIRSNILEGAVTVGGNNASFISNNVTNRRTSAYALAIGNSLIDARNVTIANNTLFSLGDWISLSQVGFGAASANFTNTTFIKTNGSVLFPGTFGIAEVAAITRQSLNISSNRVFLNSTNHTYMNTSAQITLLNVVFGNITAAVDFNDDGRFEECNPPQCVNLSYAGNIFVFNVSSFTAYSAAEDTECGSLSSSKDLGFNALSNDTCFTFAADNIYLDCHGQSVFYNANGGDNEHGVLASGRNNVTVRNCVIVDVNSSGALGIAINFTRTNNSFVIQNTIQTNGTSSNQGIRLAQSSNNTIANNTIRTNGTNDNYGIGVVGFSDRNRIENNTIKSAGTGEANHGIRIQAASGISTYFRNSVSTTGGFSYGIAITDSNSSVFVNTTLYNVTQWINSTGSNLNNFSNTSFLGINSSVLFPNFTLSGERDVTIERLNLTHNRTFLNSTSLPFMSVAARITYTGLPFSRAQALVDLDDDGMFDNCLTPQCVNLSFSGGIFIFNVSSFTTYSSQNMSGLPFIVRVILNTTNTSTNSTSQNLTALIINATDIDGEPVQNITDWRRWTGSEYKSIALIHMPFEMNTSSTATGAIRDYSTFGNNGTLGAGTAANAPTWTSSGVVGGAYDFDGSNDYISISSSSNLVSGYNSSTLTGWVRRDGTGTENFMAFKTDVGTGDVQFYFSGGSMCIWTSVTSVCGTTNVPTGTWAHYAYVREGSLLRLYVNGTLIREVVHGPSFGSPTDTYKFGTYGSAGIQFLDGAMDDVYVFNHSLSTEQINQLYQDGRAGRKLSTIVSQELTHGQNWTVTATPNDHSGDGATVSSNAVVLSNPALFHQSPVLSSTGAGVTEDNLTISAVNVNNSLGSPVRNITDWRRNGTSYALLYMPFESASRDTTGNATRSYTTFNYNGTLGSGDIAKAPTWNNSGQAGGAYIFDGSNDYIGIPKETSLVRDINNFTLTGWAQRSASGTENFMAFKTDVGTGDVQFYFSGGSICIWDSDSTTCAATGVPTGAWAHYAWLRKNKVWRLFVNGSQVGSNTSDSTSLGSPVDNYQLGSYGTPTSQFLNGSMDEVYVFNRSLTDAQLRQLFLDGFSGRHLSTIVSEETNVGDIWSVAITPNDNRPNTDGPTVFSNNFTILSEPPLSITLSKTDNPDPVNVSSLLNYTIIINVTANNATNITLVDTYPSQVVFNSSQPNATTGNSTFFIGNLTAGQFVQVNITVSVPGLANGTIISNVANISYYDSNGSRFTAQVVENTTVTSPQPSPLQANEGQIIVTLQTIASLTFAVNNVNFGSGFVNTSLGNQHCILTTEGVNNEAKCRNFTTVTSPFILENDGSNNVSVELAFSKNASAYIGGTNPQFGYKVAINETNSCSGTVGPANYTDVNITSPGTQICPNLPFLNDRDTLAIHVNVTIPYDAPTGAKNAVVIATGTAV